jgi:hypothetical protein
VQDFTFSAHGGRLACGVGADFLVYPLLLPAERSLLLPPAEDDPAGEHACGPPGGAGLR